MTARSTLARVASPSPRPASASGAVAPSHPPSLRCHTCCHSTIVVLCVRSRRAATASVFVALPCRASRRHDTTFATSLEPGPLL